jgi:anthranilate phosphoribosyltransferase
MLAEFTKQLEQGISLAPDQVASAISGLTRESISAEEKADFLASLARKGETTDEIAGFAATLRELSVTPELDPAVRNGEILDVCGTGGDRLNTFNISTTVAIIVAAAGVKVAKHGNRAITSQAGSADVLEALGVRIDLEPAAAAASLREHNFAFFFAPRYHPAFKHIAPARKLCAERGQRTIFNFLGPLLNPVRPTAQLIGVPRPDLCEPIARVLQMLGVRRGMVVCGRLTGGDAAGTQRYLDECSTLGETHVAEFYHENGFNVSVLAAAQFPVQAGTIEALAGGDRHANAVIVQRILAGEERGPKRDATLLNAAAALFVADRVKSIAEGWELAANIIERGAATAKLQALISAH